MLRLRAWHAKAEGLIIQRRTEGDGGSTASPKTGMLE